MQALAVKIGIGLLVVTAVGIAVAWALALLAESPTFTGLCDPDDLGPEAQRSGLRAALLRPAWLLSSGLGAALLLVGLVLGR
jgi:hypothetical protein